MIHLHTRSCYSLLQSTFRIEQIIQAARKNGFRHAACTDLNSMHGVMEFYHGAIKNGLHPIIGLEIKASSGQEKYSLLLLAKNDSGLQQLYRLSYQISRDKGVDLEKIQVPDCFVMALGIQDSLEESLSHNRMEEVQTHLARLKEHFGQLYAAIAMNDSSMRQAFNQALKQEAAALDIPTAAISYILYEKKEDIEQLKVLRAIDRSTIVSDPALDVLYGRFYRDEATMAALYDPEDLAETERIARECNVQMAFARSGLPAFENKLGIDSPSYLRRLCRAGLKKRLGQSDPAYEARLNYELQVIESMGFTDYFLIVWDFIRYARSQDILVGPGRGSAAGSLVAYCLGITHVDPIAAHLLFERFLNPDRVSLPDIDTDVPDDRREEVVEYLHQKYGDEHVCQIVTFSQMKPRSVIRDIGRVWTIPVRTIDQMARLIPQVPGMTLRQAYEQSSDLRRLIDSSGQNRKIYEMALQLEGLPRHTSIHAAGVVLSRLPIDQVCPRMVNEDGLCITQFPMEYLEELGLIKMDVLALRNLSIIARILKVIETRENLKLDLLKLDLEDPAVYAMLSKADTVGVFQLESDGIKQLLLDLKPVCFADISAILALYRPGPMQNIQTFIQRRRDPSQVEYLHPKLEPILKETYGIIVYQEQTMQIAQVIGQFTMAQADLFRKAISKKKSEEMAGFRKLFMAGAYRQGIREKTAATIFEWMERFAGYGFNKSHSYAYGMIVYQMAWLKCHYPLYFYQSLLNSVIGSALKSGQYIYECRTRQVRVLPVDVNRSSQQYEVEGEALRMPLSILKGVGKLVYTRIIQEREKAPFADLYDFAARMQAVKVPESVLRTLIDAGALDGFGPNRATLNKNLGRILEYCDLIRIEGEQVLFDYDIVSKPVLLKMQENPHEKLQKEYEAYGFYLSEHPVQSLRRKYFSSLLPIAQVLPQFGYFSLVGRISSFKMHKTKKGDLMSFVQLEDETQKIDLVVMPGLFQRHRDKIREGQLVMVSGKKDRPQSLLVQKIQWIDPQ